MTYCVSCKQYIKCDIRQGKNKIPYYCELYRRPRNLEARDLIYMGT